MDPDEWPEGEHPDAVRAVSALGEPSRRRIYDVVVDAGRWVSRDDVADAAGLPRASVAHHLDRLVDDGLLEVEFRRLTGRTGPGAGRPAKLYRRASGDISVDLPPRDYRLAAELLAEAVARSLDEGGDLATSLEVVAAERGRAWARIVAERLRGADGRRAPARRRAVIEFLESQGYEPDSIDARAVVLRNCPFDRLATQHTDLVCGMNHCLVSSMVDAVGRTGTRASLEPDAVNCCVVIRND